MLYQTKFTKVQKLSSKDFLFTFFTEKKFQKVEIIFIGVAQKYIRKYFIFFIW